MGGAPTRKVRKSMKWQASPMMRPPPWVGDGPQGVGGRGAALVTSLQGTDDLVSMQVMTSEDANGVHFRVLQDFVFIGSCEFKTKFFRCEPGMEARTGGDRHQINSWQFFQGWQVFPVINS